MELRSVSLSLPNPPPLSQRISFGHSGFYAALGSAGSAVLLKSVGSLFRMEDSYHGRDGLPFAQRSKQELLNLGLIASLTFGIRWAFGSLKNKALEIPIWLLAYTFSEAFSRTLAWHQQIQPLQDKALLPAILPQASAFQVMLPSASRSFPSPLKQVNYSKALNGFIFKPESPTNVSTGALLYA